MLSPLCEFELNNIISNFILPNSRWDWDTLPHEICSEIDVIHPDIRNEADDLVIWNHRKMETSL